MRRVHDVRTPCGSSLLDRGPPGPTSSGPVSSHSRGQDRGGGPIRERVEKGGRNGSCIVLNTQCADAITRISSAERRSLLSLGLYDMLHTFSRATRRLSAQVVFISRYAHTCPAHLRYLCWKRLATHTKRRKYNNKKECRARCLVRKKGHCAETSRPSCVQLCQRRPQHEHSSSREKNNSTINVEQWNQSAIRHQQPPKMNYLKMSSGSSDFYLAPT